MTDQMTKDELFSKALDLQEDIDNGDFEHPDVDNWENDEAHFLFEFDDGDYYQFDILVFPNAGKFGTDILDFDIDPSPLNGIDWHLNKLFGLCQRKANQFHRKMTG